MIVVMGTGCAGFPRHRLPEVGELAPPADQSRAVRSSYEFKWRPAVGPDSDMPQREREQHAKVLEEYAKEFGDTLKESGYFAFLRPGKGESFHIDACMEGTDAHGRIENAGDISTAMKIWASVFGLSLTTIPCWVSQGYKAKVVVTTKGGISKEYNLDDAETVVFWFPLIVATPFTPFTNPARVDEHVRKNMYKTLILRMQEDGILPPAKRGIQTSYVVGFELSPSAYNWGTGPQDHALE